MFDIGWSELVVIGVVALIAIGPKELPGVLRTVGQYMGKVRKMASEFQGQFQEAMREAEMADLKKSVDDITDTAKSFTNFDPMAGREKGGRCDDLRSARAHRPRPPSASPAGRVRRARRRRFRLTCACRPIRRSPPKRRSPRKSPGAARDYARRREGDRGVEGAAARRT